MGLQFQHVEKAVNFWQDALEVVQPTTSPIRMSHSCQNGFYSDFAPPNPATKYCSGSCPTIEMCGDSIVPKKHLGECYSCSRGRKSSCRKDRLH